MNTEEVRREEKKGLKGWHIRLCQSGILLLNFLSLQVEGEEGEVLKGMA